MKTLRPSDRQHLRDWKAQHDADVAEARERMLQRARNQQHFNRLNSSILLWAGICVALALLVLSAILFTAYKIALLFA